MRNLLVLLSGLIMLPTAMAADGTITFNGSVVESVCDTSTQLQQASINCYRNGVNQVQTIAMSQHKQAMPYQLGTVSIETVKNHANLKIVEVTYK